MSDVIYTFQGKDITMNVCIQIRAVVDILQENLKITFEEAMLRFYCSKTYRILQETENGLNRLNILQTDILPRWHRIGYIRDGQYFVS